MKRRIKKILRSIFSRQNQNQLVEIRSIETIRPILDRFKVPLILTKSALQPSALLTILNDIVINDRRVIVETGSGVGTLFMAMVAKVYEKDIVIYSIEEDDNWINLVKASLVRESLESYVEFIHAPVNDDSVDKWYDAEVVLGNLRKKCDKIDTLIIDGPKAYKKGYEKARLKAVPVLSPYLKDRCFILVDDVHRKGERLQVVEWEKEIGVSFNKDYNTFAVAVKGIHYNFRPI